MPHRTGVVVNGISNILLSNVAVGKMLRNAMWSAYSQRVLFVGFVQMETRFSIKPDPRKAQHTWNENGDKNRTNERQQSRRRRQSCKFTFKTLPELARKQTRMQVLIKESSYWHLVGIIRVGHIKINHSLSLEHIV